MFGVNRGAQGFGSRTLSWGTARPATAFGTSVTPGTGGYGSFAQLGSDLTADAYGIVVNVNSNTASAASRNTVLKIGVDQAGGTSFSDMITGLLCGGAAGYNLLNGGISYYFPLFIPAGSAVAAAAYGSVSTAFNVNARFLQRPARPEQVRRGAFSETYGIGTTHGTAITQGTTSEGAWTLVGTTVRPVWHWQLGFQVNTGDTSWGSNVMHADLAIGDASSKHIIIEDQVWLTDGTERLSNGLVTLGCERDVPAGTNVYLRVQCSGTAEAAAVAAYAMGG